MPLAGQKMTSVYFSYASFSSDTALSYLQSGTLGLFQSMMSLCLLSVTNSSENFVIIKP